MPTFTRRRGEALMIGDDVQVKVVDIQGKEVHLGIEAPAIVRVLRVEASGAPFVLKTPTGQTGHDDLDQVMDAVRGEIERALKFGEREVWFEVRAMDYLVLGVDEAGKGCNPLSDLGPVEFYRAVILHIVPAARGQWHSRPRVEAALDFVTFRKSRGHQNRPIILERHQALVEETIS
jgi:carbon storage regulator